MCTQGNQAGHALQHTYWCLMNWLVWLSALSTTTRINCFTVSAHHWELVVQRGEKTVFVCSLLAPTYAIPTSVTSEKQEQGAKFAFPQLPESNMLQSPLVSI